MLCWFVFYCYYLLYFCLLDAIKKIMKIVGLVKKEEVKEMTDRLIEDLTLKEGYINGKPTTITIERIINEKRELV